MIVQFPWRVHALAWNCRDPAGHHPCSEPGNAPDEGAGLNPELDPELAHVYGQGIGGDAAKADILMFWEM
ncbi:hypothetical protein [Acidithiobacillus ferriphilus]|uniref:hypothetical protein n=1 Tax=Acidithiobacillus ferriphilus TaxID=1689834 RepID=UPI001E55857F|nr:hypothetical protein [Acidithiobacillus ferriphilus]UEP57994.1 hypothetical protein K1Y48_06395 [Acidithiobacillus ferriphilus]